MPLSVSCAKNTLFSKILVPVSSSIANSLPLEIALLHYFGLVIETELMNFVDQTQTLIGPIFCLPIEFF